MATVIEILNKKGEATSFNRFDQLSITVGRGYDNDVTVADETLDAKHLIIQKIEDGRFRVIDQGSTNGIQLHKKSPKNNAARSILDLSSGDEVSLGHSRIRIVDSSLAIPAAKPIRPERRLTRLLKHPALVAVLLVASLCSQMYQNYVREIVEIEISDYVMSFFQTGAVVFVICLLLTLLGKAIRHQWLVLENIVNVCIFILLTNIGGWLQDVIFFNTGYWYSQWLLEGAAEFLVASLGAWIITVNVFSNKPLLRTGIVFSFAGLVFTYSLVQAFADDQEFDKIRPVVTDKFKSWVLPFNDPVDDQQFINDSQFIFEFAPATDEE